MIVDLNRAFPGHDDVLAIKHESGACTLIIIDGEIMQCIAIDIDCVYQMLHDLRKAEPIGDSDLLRQLSQGEGLAEAERARLSGTVRHLRRLGRLPEARRANG